MLSIDISADEKMAEDNVDAKPSVNPTRRTMFAEYIAVRLFLLKIKTIANSCITNDATNKLLHKLIKVLIKFYFCSPQSF